jgi:hypothetical protein
VGAASTLSACWRGSRTPRQRIPGAARLVECCTNEGAHPPILVLEASTDPSPEPVFLSSAHLPIYSYSDLRIRQRRLST